MLEHSGVAMIMNEWRLEQAEREHQERMEKLERELGEIGWDIDGEDYEAWLWAMEKDD